jgi:hypothetical protein
VIFGSREFINDWFERNRDRLGGASRDKRKTGARKIGKGNDWKHLYTLRQLQIQAVPEVTPESRGERGPPNMRQSEMTGPMAHGAQRPVGSSEAC